MCRPNLATVLIFLLLPMVSISSGCIEETKEKERTEVVILGTTDKIVSLDPAKAYDYLSVNVINNVFEGLVGYEVGSSNIVPLLAESWEVKDNGMTYLFKLRKGVKFHDGSEFNAEVMEKSIKRAMELKGDPSFLLDVIDEVKAVDEYTLEIKLKYPFSPFLSVLAFSVASAVSPSYGEEFTDEAIGTGPYKLEKWTRDVELVLVRNEEYWGEKARTKRFVIRFYQDSSQLRLAIERGEIDIAYRELKPLDIIDLKEKKGDLIVLEGDSPVIRYLVFNVKKEPFNNLSIRKAISLAINRKEIAEKIFFGTVKPLYSMVPEGMWSHSEVFPERDLKRSSEILRSLGYSEEKPLEITLWYTPTHYGPTEADVAQMIKQQLEETGLIKVNLESVEWATYTDYMRKGTMGFFLLGWYPDYLDPDDYLWPFLQSDASPSLGSFYSNERMDELLLEARKAESREEREKIYKEVQELLAQEVPYIPLWQGRQYVVLRRGVRGVVLEPTQIFRYYIVEKGAVG